MNEKSLITPNDEFHVCFDVNPSELVDDMYYLICGQLSTNENGKLYY